MQNQTTSHLWGLAAMLFLCLTSCGSQQASEVLGTSTKRPVVVATTSILGDVVVNLTGGQVEVITIMPNGADPHHFQPSAQNIATIDSASAVVANGAFFEEGLLDALNAAETSGTPVFEAIAAVDQLGNARIDPHFFTDPARMAAAVDGIAEFLIANVDDIDAEKLALDTEKYVAALLSLDAEVEAQLASVSDANRVLITNHHVFGYFADRYDFDVIGTVFPLGSDTNSVSGRRLFDLAKLLEGRGVSVIFSDISSSDELAQTLADEVEDVVVLQLYTESLGGSDSAGATYIEMVRSNARTIATALGT